jgi:hypothetical protein
MARRPRMNWRAGQVVQLRRGDTVQPHQPWGSDAYIAARYWREFALGLILPRHFPEHVSDADIEATIRHVVATEWLPWELDFSGME